VTATADATSVDRRRWPSGFEQPPSQEVGIMTMIFELAVIDDGVTGAVAQVDARETRLSRCHNRHDTFACGRLVTAGVGLSQDGNISRRK
jgi:transcription termination factor Rho